MNARLFVAPRACVAASTWLLVFSLTDLLGCSDSSTVPGRLPAAARAGDGEGQVIDGEGEVATACPGAPGCECQTNEDCATLCIETPTGNRCGKACQSNCMDGFKCTLVPAPGGDDISLCFWRWGRLCEPCSSSAMCGGALGSGSALCIDYGGRAGAFCGAACSTNAECPSGYLCGEGKTIEGQTAKQCLRQAELDGTVQCPCDARAMAKELATACHADLPGGACAGTRTCTANGLGPCTAGAVETCDGIDNNCNGLTDDLACDDQNVCTDDVCDVPTKTCLHPPNMAGCDDGNPCTVATACQAGVCGGGAPLNCDDGNPCTTDICGADGCGHVLLSGTACSDGDPCTLADACQGGTCAAGDAQVCDDGNPCTTDGCDKASGACVFQLNTASCDDGNECTGADKCQDGACAGTTLSCDDKNLCTTDTCDPKLGCVYKPNTLPCDDDNACTSGDTCQDGACKAGPSDTTTICDDGNPCTTDGCSPKLGCTHVANTLPCDDGSVCTKGDVCVAGTCEPGENTCSCKADADCAPMDDGNLCNGLLFCDKSTPDWKCRISVASVVTCDASGDTFCARNVCDATTGKCGLVAQQEGKACDADQSVCTVGDACVAGVCTAGPALPCEDGNVCTTNACDPLEGCKFFANGVACSDGNGCTVGDACKADACIAGAWLACDDGNPCTTDSCDPTSGTCVFANNTSTCDDGNACSQDDKCQGGACVGTAANCDDKNPCTSDSCNPGTGCVHAPNTIACDDNNACTTGDVCAGATCSGSAVNPATLCDDQNPCTTDSCTAALGCGHTANALACDDGNGCTIGDTCEGGACKSGTNSCGCTQDADCGSQEDGNLCNGTLFCDKTSLPYACKVNPKTIVTCDAGDDTTCRKNTCTPATGTCGFASIHEGQACNADGSVCTVGDKCTAGTCVAGSAMNCNDGNACSDDACDAVLGCTHWANAAPCSDGNACTIGDVCNNSACMSGYSQACNDANPCTNDTCNTATGACVFTNNTAPCDDGNACSQGDTCAGGTCSGVAMVCNDNNLCTSDSCNPKSGCVVANNILACNDNNACTQNDTCGGGTCKGSAVDAASFCDDGNPCTNDGCNPSLGCVHVANTAACDDGNGCTTGDTCASGVCVSGTSTCGCTQDLDCAGQEDGNLCNGTLFCDKSALPYKCVVNPKTVVKCDAGADTACTRNLCDGATGECGYVAQNEGKGCDADQSVCTVGDACLAGVCQPGVALDCGDGNPCTDDACNPASGCTHAINASPCADGNPCTVGDLCKLGSCAPGTAKDCNDQNPCTNDGCNAATGLCESTPNAAPCNDGNACTAGDACANSHCVGTPIACNDKNPCTDDMCDPQTGCVLTPNTMPCNDNNACTEGDVCAAGTCAGMMTKSCNDNNACTNDSCDPAVGCVNTANAAACDDGNACTQNDTCSQKACAGVAYACNDSNICTSDSCNPASGCVFAANNLPCNDGNACTQNDLCSGGACAGTATAPAVLCSDGNPCTNDSCDPKLGCMHANNTAACDDGNGCTVGDVCQSGICKSGTNTCGCNQDGDCAGQEDGNLCNGTLYCNKSALPYHCVVNPLTVVSCNTSGDNACRNTVCNTATGQCGYVNQANGKACNADGSVCTPIDTCQAGVCTAGAALNCDDANPCTNDACDAATGCTHVASTLACSDGNGCTVGDVCKNGACASGALTVCSDGNVCTVDSCNTVTGLCVFNGTPQNGAACDADGSVCTVADKCSSGVCVAGAPLSCDDGNVCTNDACSPVGGCSHTANTAPCSDGTSCTFGDMCQGSVCVPGAAVPSVSSVPVTMTQSGGGKVDVIVWIDTSGSMTQEAQYLNENINAFMQYLGEAGLDYHLVLIGYGQNLCSVGCPANPRFLWIKQAIDSHNGLTQMQNVYSQYEAFLRPDAVKNIVAVTDDNSSITAATFEAQMLTKPKFAPSTTAPRGFIFHSIVAFDPLYPDNSSKICSTGAHYGASYLQLTKDTVGSKFPICDTNWAPIFSSLADHVVATVTIDCGYGIQVPTNVTFDPTTLKISQKDGTPPNTVTPLVRVDSVAGCAAQPKGWYYNNPTTPTAISICDTECKTLTADDILLFDYGCK